MITIEEAYMLHQISSLQPDSTEREKQAQEAFVEFWHGLVSVMLADE